ncbi:MAG: type II toxin-antitoxin system HicB family antitoxin [Chloroflexota bacterium]|nr:type II toxin-antitoxin system HicB family antitoxin [Chloroflexota bacterium]
MNYLVIIEGAGRSSSAYSPDLPGCVAAGESPEDVEQLMQEAIPLHLETLRTRGGPTPEPESLVRYVTAG